MSFDGLRASFSEDEVVRIGTSLTTMAFVTVLRARPFQYGKEQTSRWITICCRRLSKKPHGLETETLAYWVQVTDQISKRQNSRQ